MKPIFIGMAAGAALAILRQFATQRKLDARRRESDVREYESVSTVLIGHRLPATVSSPTKLVLCSSQNFRRLVIVHGPCKPRHLVSRPGSRTLNVTRVCDTPFSRALCAREG